MRLEKIITLANEPVRLRFLALERSLRAVGCDLPIWVIPYDERRFDLPKNSTWWSVEPLNEWLKAQGAPTVTRKYQCLTVGNYQFVDSDLVFLRNPVEVLADLEGFIASCTHWNNPEETTTPESREILRSKSLCWPRDVFNSGQFACDRALYTLDELKRQCLDSRHAETCLHGFHEQPGMVLLANLSGVPISNLTLPPVNMESTWAGDYADPGYERYWLDPARKPYLIHWAGCTMYEPRAIDRLFTDFLTVEERQEWQQQMEARRRKDRQEQGSLRSRLRRVARGLQAFRRELRG